jgi:hypothetical protein
MRWLDRSLLSSPCAVGICFTESDLRRELRRLKVSPEMWPGWIGLGKDGHVLRLESPDTGQTLCIVCVNYDGRRDVVEAAGLLVHEAVHVWQAIREEIGEGDPSSEFEAYSIQNISQRLIGEWVDMGKKKGGKKKGCK